MAYADPRGIRARREAAREARFRQESQREADAHSASADARAKATMEARRLERAKVEAAAVREGMKALLWCACAVVGGLLLAGLLAAWRAATS
jgi:hypothetical protein